MLRLFFGCVWCLICFVLFVLLLLVLLFLLLAFVSVFVLFLCFGRAATFCNLVFSFGCCLCVLLFPFSLKL